MFTELSVGERVSPRQALPGRRTGYAGWTVENTSVEEVRASSVGATVPPPAKAGELAAMAFPEPRALPPGFRKLTQVSRTLPGHDRPVMQAVYSDGLATLSVFIDPDVARVAGHEGISQRGAVGVVTRAAGDRAVITVGEIPTAALRKVEELGGVDLATVPMESGNQEDPQALSQRIEQDLGFEFADDFAGVPQLDAGGEPAFDQISASLGQPCSIGNHPRAVACIRKNVTAEHRKRTT